MDFCQICEKKEKIAAMACCGKVICRKCKMECGCFQDSTTMAKKFAQAQQEELNRIFEEDQRLAATLQLNELNNSLPAISEQIGDFPNSRIAAPQISIRPFIPLPSVQVSH